jgi:ribosomal protein L29
LSGETAKAESGWTTDTLKEYVEQRFTDQSKAVDAALTAAKQAVEKEERNSEKWRQSANEWRQSMLDREIKFASRNEVDAELKGIRSELATLKENQAAGGGEKSGRLSSQQFLMMIVSLVGSLILIGGTVTAIAFAIRR